jgi:hypothetical protein
MFKIIQRIGKDFSMKLKKKADIEEMEKEKVLQMRDAQEVSNGFLGKGFFEIY